MNPEKKNKKPEALLTIKKEPYVRKWGNQFSKKYTDEEIERLGDSLLSWMESKDENLWYKDFCITERIAGSRLAEFAKQNAYFSWVLSLCKDLQESRMFKLGTSKVTNPAMFILGLKNNHGWTDKNEVSINKVDGIVFVE